MTARVWINRRGVLGLCAAALLLGLAGIARADDAPAPDAGGTGTAAPSVVIHGFRSADFGMTETEVRAAIIHDFGIHARDVHASADAIQQTHVLQIGVPDLIPKGGPALVNYVFGYQSKRLFQVQVLWARQKNGGTSTEQLLTDGKLLANYFASAGYLPQSVQTNIPVKEGVVLFRGMDGDDHATVLILHGVFGQTKDKQQLLVPTALTLDYINHPKTPDVFRLSPGKF